ncbi:MAG: atpH [Candidatus Saccharibacteria bacterium]|nr:atpH [Candidatus Saccharibacteria bacterium]
MAIRVSRRKISNYIADQIAEGHETKKLIQELAAFLIDTRRTKELELVVRDIEYELKNRGIVLAWVTSAHDLTSATKTAINKLIKDQTDAKNVELQELVDPTVLGGVKIDLPGQQLDMTIARRLSLLRTNVKE